MKFLHQEETRKKNPSSRWDSYLLFENRFMNFELVLKDTQKAGCGFFFRPMRNSILGNLGSTEDQSRTKNPRSLKRTTKWGAKYFTHEKSYYPVPNSSMELGDVNVMKTPPVVSTDPQIETAIKELVADIVLSGKERYAVKPRKTKQELYRQQYIPVNLEKESSKIHVCHHLQIMIMA